MSLLTKLRLVIGFSFIGLFVEFIAPVAIGAPDPPPPCNGETGPHDGAWSCVQSGTITNQGHLTWTNSVSLQGSTLVPPAITGVVIGPGKEQRLIYYDCPWNYYLNHYETNQYYYSTNLYFSPAFPTTANTAGTNIYSAYVYFTSPGNVCPYLPMTGSIFIGKVTNSVFSNADSDYDGISDYQEIQNGTDPFNPDSASQIRLGYWPFDNTNTWVGSAGQLPLVASNVVGIASWNTNAVQIDSVTTAILKYRDVETNGNANINLRNGTVRFWFKPDWSSISAGGVGPQSEGRLLELGTKGSTNGWWGLVIGSGGMNIYFGTQTNSIGTLTTNLATSIIWTSNIWHQLALTYSATNSALYLDGAAVVTNGLGVGGYPVLAVRAQGFNLGNSSSGTNQVRGVFEELETFNYPQDAATISASYLWATSLDSDGDGLSNIIENQMGLNPYLYNSPNSLSSANGLQVFTPLH